MTAYNSITLYNRAANLMFGFVAVLLLAGCGTHPINWETGEGCRWHNVEEHNNTGRMTDTPLDEIPVVYLDYGDLNKPCRNDSFHLRACYDWITDTIYLGDEQWLNEERCHALLGPVHAAW